MRAAAFPRLTRTTCLPPWVLPYPSPYQAYTPPTGNTPQDYYASHQDNPKDELYGKYAPNLSDPGNQLQLLTHDPLRTGISHPPLDPTIINGFDGMNFLDSVNGYVPPDTIIGVGPQYVVETVNAQIQFYDKVTGAALLAQHAAQRILQPAQREPLRPQRHLRRHRRPVHRDGLDLQQPRADGRLEGQQPS